MTTPKDPVELLKAREQEQQDKARAEGRRPLSAVKRRMIESSVKIAATLPDEVLFQHTVRYTATNPARFERLWR